MQNAYFARASILTRPVALAKNQPLMPKESLKICPGREAVVELLLELIRGITEHKKTTRPSGGHPEECALRVPPWRRKNSRNCAGKGLPSRSYPRSAPAQAIWGLAPIQYLSTYRLTNRRFFSRATSISCTLDFPLPWSRTMSLEPEFKALIHNQTN